MPSSLEEQARTLAGDFIAALASEITAALQPPAPVNDTVGPQLEQIANDVTAIKGSVASLESFANGLTTSQDQNGTVSLTPGTRNTAGKASTVSTEVVGYTPTASNTKKPLGQRKISNPVKVITPKPKATVTKATTATPKPSSQKTFKGKEPRIEDGESDASEPHPTTKSTKRTAKSPGVASTEAKQPAKKALAKSKAKATEAAEPILEECSGSADGEDYLSASEGSSLGSSVHCPSPAAKPTQTRQSSRRTATPAAKTTVLTKATSETRKQPEIILSSPMSSPASSRASSPDPPRSPPATRSKRPASSDAPNPEPKRPRSKKA